MPSQSMATVRQPPQSQEDLTMPSSTPKQQKTMAAAAHNPAFASKVGIPVKVAKEFNDADMRRKQGQLATALRGKGDRGGQI